MPLLIVIPGAGIDVTHAPNVDAGLSPELG